MTIVGCVAGFVFGAVSPLRVCSHMCVCRAERGHVTLGSLYRLSVSAWQRLRGCLLSLELLSESDVVLLLNKVMMEYS
jgi:hypothetical protein